MRRMSQRSEPIPRIMPLHLRPALVHGRAHGSDRLVEAEEDRLADQGMADVELDDLRDRRDGPDGVEVEAVPGMDLETDPGAVLGCLAQALEFVGDPGWVAVDHRLAIGAGVELDHGRAGGAGSLHDLDLRLHEQRHPDALPASSWMAGRRWTWAPTMSSPPSVVRSSRFSGTRQAACGRMRGDADHLGGRRHLEVERHEELALEPLHIRRPGCAAGPPADAPVIPSRPRGQPCSRPGPDPDGCRPAHSAWSRRDRY